jgi:hypothetical protein
MAARKPAPEVVAAPVLEKGGSSPSSLGMCSTHASQVAELDSSGSDTVTRNGTSGDRRHANSKGRQIPCRTHRATTRRGSVRPERPGCKAPAGTPSATPFRGGRRRSLSSTRPAAPRVARPRSPGLAATTDRVPAPGPAAPVPVARVQGDSQGPAMARQKGVGATGGVAHWRPRTRSHPTLPEPRPRAHPRQSSPRPRTDPG